MWHRKGEVTVEEEELTGNTQPSQSLQGHLKASQESDPCNKQKDEQRTKWETEKRVPDSEAMTVCPTVTWRSLSYKHKPLMLQGILTVQGSISIIISPEINPAHVKPWLKVTL